MFKGWLTDLKKFLGNRNMVMAFLLLLILGFTFGYYATEIIDKKSNMGKLDAKIMEEEVQPLTDEENIPTLTKAERIKVVPNTRIVFETKFLKSNDTDKQVKDPEQEIIGLSKEDIEDYYSGWTVASFTEEEIILRRTIDSYSPKHFKVGIKKKDEHEYITVYSFTESGEEVVDYISDKPIELLSKEDQDKLREGMIFDSMDDVYRMLENYDL